MTIKVNCPLSEQTDQAPDSVHSAELAPDLEVQRADSVDLHPHTVDPVLLWVELEAVSTNPLPDSAVLELDLAALNPPDPVSADQPDSVNLPPDLEVRDLQAQGLVVLVPDSVNLHPHLVDQAPDSADPNLAGPNLVESEADLADRSLQVQISADLVVDSADQSPLDLNLAESAEDLVDRGLSDLNLAESVAELADPSL